jgi:hypothetical protein
MLPCVDAPELVQSTERAAKEQARKERKRAYLKAYRLKNIDALTAKTRIYTAKNRERRKAYKKAYAAVNPDKIKASRSKHYAANADKIKTSSKAYYNANRDKIAAVNKRYRAKNIDYVKTKKKNYHAANRDKMLAQKKIYYAANSDKYRAYHQKRYAANADKIKEYAKVHRLRKYGCVTCKTWPDWRVGRPHYDGMCYRCFCEKFPTHEKVRTKVRVELQVRAFIDSNFAEFVHDKPMHTAHCDCNHRRRVDHRRLVGNTLLCIETDEHHHRGYDKDDEQARYHDVLCVWGGKLCFVRFNPDGRGPPLEEWLERLRAEVTRHVGRLERCENTAFLEVHHLYYPAGTEDYYEQERA